MIHNEYFVTSFSPAWGWNGGRITHDPAHAVCWMHPIWIGWERGLGPLRMPSAQYWNQARLCCSVLRDLLGLALLGWVVANAVFKEGL